MPTAESVAKGVVKTQEKSLGATMMRWSAGIALLPDPIPLVDEILLGVVFGIGAGLYLHGSGVSFGSNPVPSISPSQTVTSTSGHTKPRGKVKKQMRSTSHSYSRRNNYYKRKRYYRN